MRSLFQSIKEGSALIDSRCVAKAQGVVEKIKQAGGTAIAVTGDMLDAKHIDELVKKAAEFGGGKIHIIVNNAGFTWDGVIHKVSDQISQPGRRSTAKDEAAYR